MNWLKTLMHYTKELVKRRYFDSEKGDIEGKMLIITGLASTAALIFVEHKYIMMQKYQNFSKIIAQLLIIISL